MILKSLKLANIRSYTSEVITFPEGSVLLSGDIGSGKSTILLAIEFALFGFMRSTLTGDTLLRNGKHEGSVELHFKANEKNIIIKRVLRRGSSVKQESGYIIIDDVKTDCTTLELKARVLEILGYSEDMLTKTKDLIYRYTVYTPQEETKKILLDSKENRLETLRRVFNIDKYRKIRTNILIILKKLKLKRANYEGQLTTLPEKQAGKKEYIFQMKEIEKQCEELIPQFSLLKDSLQEKKELLNIEKKKKEMLQNYKQELSMEEIKIKNLLSFKENNSLEIEQAEKKMLVFKEKLKTLVVEKPSERSYDTVEAELESLEKNIKEFQEKKIKNVQELHFNARRLKDFRGEVDQKSIQLTGVELKKKSISRLSSICLSIEKVKKEFQILEKNITATSGYAKEHEITIDNAERIKQKIIQLNQCPTCFQVVGEEHKHEIYKTKDKEIHDATAQLATLKQNRRNTEVEAEEKRKVIDELEKEEKDLERMSLEIKSLEYVQKEVLNKQKIIEKLEEDKKILDKEAEELNNFDENKARESLNFSKQLLKKIQKYNEIAKEKESAELQLFELEEKQKRLLYSNEKIKVELQDHKDGVIELSAKIEQLKYSEVIFAELEKNVEDLLRKDRDLEIQKTKLESERHKYEELIEKIDFEIHEKLFVKKKLDRLNNYVDWLSSHVINLTVVMEKHVMMQLYHEFNRLFVDWFKLLVDDELLTVRLDDEFSPIIEQNGYEVDITNVSGGERTAVCLAYRLALNKVINEFITTIKTKDILILDEPTEGFSHEQLDKLKDVLDELDIKQVIIVSHEAKVESFVDSVLRVEKSEHVSRVIGAI